MNKKEQIELCGLEKRMKAISMMFFENKGFTKRETLSDFDDNKEKDLFIEKVEDAFSKLSPLEKMLINNDFFFEDYPDWWKEIFSEEKYLDLKRKAIIKFLVNFYEE